MSSLARVYEVFFYFYFLNYTALVFEAQPSLTYSRRWDCSGEDMGELNLQSSLLGMLIVPAKQSLCALKQSSEQLFKEKVCSGAFTGLFIPVPGQ